MGSLFMLVELAVLTEREGTGWWTDEGGEHVVGVPVRLK